MLGVLGAWFALDAAALEVLAHQADTVLPGYVAQTALLALGVGVGVVLLGTACAAAVTLFDFAGRRVFEWALLLPLAMPAYVLAYAWTDALQYSSPLQAGLRRWLDVQGALWPDVRSLWGAVILFVLCLYPYVYLLTRAALSERDVRMMEAAPAGRSLPPRAAVALPLARPAIAAGTAMALIETLADYGVGAYFGLTTFSIGVYKAWMVMNDRVAAAQLASLLLLAVALLLTAERRAQARLRFAAGRGGQGSEARPVPLRGRAAAAAWILCALPVALGFVLPVLWLLRMLWAEAAASEIGLPLERFVGWSTSLRLAALAALAATLLALALGMAQRRHGASGLLPLLTRVVSLGYAVPGAVVAVGILLPLGWVQQRWPDLGVSVWVAGASAGLMYACLGRFSAVALQSVESGLARVPRSIDESARLLGAGPRRMFVQLHLPLLRRSALAAALLVFVDVMKELPAAGAASLRRRHAGGGGLARDERLGEAALPSLAIVAVGLLPVLLLSRALRQKSTPSATP